MRFVIWKGEPPNKVVNVELQEPNGRIAWLSTGWAPTQEDYDSRGRIHGGEFGFPRIASSLVPEGCKVYAAIGGGVLHETELMVQDIQTKGLRFERPSVTGSVAKRLLRGTLKPGDGIFVESDREYVSYCFEKYGSWTSDSWSFLVSRGRLDNWPEYIRFVSHGGVITEKFLEKFELFFANRWEHGFEVLSCKLKYEQLKEMTRDAAQKLNWALVEAPDSSRETLQKLKVW